MCQACSEQAEPGCPSRGEGGAFPRRLSQHIQGSTTFWLTQNGSGDTPCAAWGASGHWEPAGPSLLPCCAAPAEEPQASSAGAEGLGRLCKAAARCFCSYNHCKTLLLAGDTFWLCGTQCARLSCTPWSALGPVHLQGETTEAPVGSSQNPSNCGCRLQGMCRTVSVSASFTQTGPGSWCTFHACRSFSPEMGMWQLLCESLRLLRVRAQVPLVICQRCVLHELRVTMT